MTFVWRRPAVSRRELFNTDNGHFDSYSAEGAYSIAVWPDLLPVQFGEDQQ